jgi:hypothetical protein
MSALEKGSQKQSCPFIPNGSSKEVTTEATNNKVSINFIVQ